MTTGRINQVAIVAKPLSLPQPRPSVLKQNNNSSPLPFLLVRNKTTTEFKSQSRLSLQVMNSLQHQTNLTVDSIVRIQDTTSAHTTTIRTKSFE